MKRIGLVTILSVLVVMPALGQTRPTWPDIRLSGCPSISPPKSLKERTWKHSEGEQNDFQAAGKVQDRKQAAEILISFAGKYPDSDYRELALILAMGIGASLKDMNLQSDAAKVLVEAPAGEATAMVAAFVPSTRDSHPTFMLVTQKKRKS